MGVERKTYIKEGFQNLQDHITKAIEKADEKGKFIEDLWLRPEGGGGRSRVMLEGNIIEKGGVNFSAVEGKLPEKIATALKVDAADFFATGVSIVMHPNHPLVPIIHMNVRYFELSNGLSWFGGGIDLTPHYIDKKDAQHFHQEIKNLCDRYDSSWYTKFKKWADDYFFIPHRNETRGVGGIFFDRLKPNDEAEAKNYYNYCEEIGFLFAEIYSKFMQENSKKPYTENHKDWQMIRRSRYVEFNLVYDKGTKFGLDTNGRTESILMSMPPTANWKYNYQATPNSEEEKTLQLLKKDIDWVSVK